MAVRIWGVDLGADSVKVCVLQSRFRGFTIERVDAEPVRAGPGVPLLAAQKAALATLVAAAQARPDVVVAALPGSGAAAHLVTLPQVDRKRIEQALAFEVEGLIPFELSDVAYDHQPLDEQDGKARLLVGLARRPLLLDVLAALRDAGLDPRTVTLAPFSLAGLFPAGEPPPEGHELLLDIGKERTCVVVRERGRLLFARAFDGGGASLTRAVAQELKLDFAAAEVQKRGRGSLLADGDPALVLPLAGALQPLLRELRQTLKMVSAGSPRPLAKIWLAGGGGKLAGLPELLERDLGGSVEPLPLPRVGGEEGTPADSPAALAVSLALGAHGRARFNLRRGDQSFQGDFAKLRGKLGQVGALAASLVLLAGVRGYTQIHELSRREMAIDDAVCAATKQAIGRCVKDINMARSSLAGGAAAGGTIPRYSALDLLSETAKRLDVEGAKVTELDVGTGQVDLRGEADSFETVDKVVAALKGWRCFQEVQRGRVQKARDGKTVEFNLQARNACASSRGK